MFRNLNNSNNFTGMLGRNDGRELFRPLFMMVRWVLNKHSNSWTGHMVRYIQFIGGLRRRGGIPFVVAYLKTSQLLVMQSTSGMKIADPRSLGAAVARTGGGLPRFIPKAHRLEMRKGNRTVIRVWITWLSLFRVLDYPGKLKLSTITKPGSFALAKVLDFLPVFLHRLGGFTGKGSSIADYLCSMEIFDLLKTMRKGPTQWARKHLQARPYFIAKSSPGGGMSTGVKSILRDAFLWFHKDIAVWNAYSMWLKYTENDYFAQFMLLAYETVKAFPEEARIARLRPLGRLSTKEEPAGKIRVFAIVDCWTQWVLKPLHDGIFELLRTIPQDGTFDQIAPIRLLMKKFPQGPFYSYDLSAATDRLPCHLQTVILGPIIGRELAVIWETILTGRSYRLPSSDTEIQYAVGQPMGALSSWAMLALTHHFIVQAAASRAHPDRYGWFEGYAVLGDDIVIADERVAQEYLHIMTVELGVEINLSKSLVSQTLANLEFAKRFVHSGVDSSPFSFKELLAGQSNFAILREAARKANLTLASVMVLAGYSPRTLDRLTMSSKKDLDSVRMSGYLLHLLAWEGSSPSPVSGYGLDKDMARTVLLSLTTRLITAIQRRMKEYADYTGYYEWSGNLVRVRSESSSLQGKGWVTSGKSSQVFAEFTSAWVMGLFGFNIPRESPHSSGVWEGLSLALPVNRTTEISSAKPSYTVMRWIWDRVYQQKVDSVQILLGTLERKVDDIRRLLSTSELTDEEIDSLWIRFRALEEGYQEVQPAKSVFKRTDAVDTRYWPSLRSAAFDYLTVARVRQGVRSGKISLDVKYQVRP